MTDMRYKQIHTMRLHCLYPKNSYEYALQYINNYTWKQCISKVIEELVDSGIKNIKDKMTVMLLHKQFRENGLLTSPYIIPKAEPFEFLCIDKLKPSIIAFCNKSILEGTLSAEVFLAEVKNKIMSAYYNLLIKDLPVRDKDNIPDHEILLHQLHLKTIS